MLRVPASSSRRWGERAAETYVEGAHIKSAGVHGCRIPEAGVRIARVEEAVICYTRIPEARGLEAWR